MLESLPLPSPKLEAIPAGTLADTEVIVAGLTQDGTLSATLAKLDAECGGVISRLVQSGQIRGKAGEMTMIALAALADSSPPDADPLPAVVLAVGLGKEAAAADDDPERRRAMELSAAVIRKLADRPRGSITIALAESFSSAAHDVLVTGALHGCEGQAIYQDEAALIVPDVIRFSGITDEALQRGRVIGDAINQTRRLVNEPPAVIYPESFAARATALADDAGLTIETWDEKKLDEEGCRAILAVGRGSTRPPRLVIMRHDGGGSEPPIALVGKGVTFDSGGLSLKPSEGMVAMKCDMAGAATVVGAMLALKRLGVKRNVIGLCGLAENMVSGDSYKLGDVIETRSGKTIEIMNTDAEGRVVLADTLDVAIQFQPSAMIDLATLTGASLVALGTEVAALMTNNSALCDEVIRVADNEGERVWQLPMHRFYNEQIKSKVADIKNTGEGRFGGAITAAKFLENFVGDVPWLHMDIAGPAFSDQPKPHRDAGATGVMVRTLVRWIEDSAAH
tara:strand:+ start:495836 stop:497362 length:1527 start_codon:yes stop_codon:yes gene_type:complete